MQDQNQAAFINRIAELLTARHRHQLDRVAVVFPNRRAAIFLRQAIANQVKDFVWSPQIYSTQDFVNRLFPSVVLEAQELVFELFEVYKKCMAEKADDFESFLQWAPALLHDFNDIDLYVSNPKELFDFLSEAKAIELWSPEIGKLSEMQQQYLQFWQSLFQLHRQFRQHLKGQNKAYPGMAYREVAEMPLEQYTLQGIEKIYFAGFNALTSAEKIIMQRLCENGLAEMIWDADAYYFNDPLHEAGNFLRRIAQDWGVFTEISPGNDLLEKPREIHSIGVAKNMAQVQTAGRIIEKLLTEGVSLSDIALVLADESLLPAQLEYLPAAVEKVNITMGYPLQATGASVLLKQLIRWHISSIQLSQRLKSDQQLCYFSTTEKLMQHPLLQKLLSEKSALKSWMSYAAQNIESKNIYLHCAELQQSVNHVGLEPLKDFFEPQSIHNGQLLMNKLVQLFDQLLYTDALQSKDEQIELEALFKLRKILNATLLHLEKYQTNISLPSLEQMLLQQIMAGNISFVGEPLEGLQIMGMLETRCLDFPHVIMVSVNEEILPKGRSNHSFIPLDIRRKFALPVFNDSDAIFSYHFYRLLQRSKEVYLLYNTEPDELGKGEPSRFILQLEQELKDSKTKFERHVAPSDTLNSIASFHIRIEKDEQVMARLNNAAAYGLSPSAINTFNTCSLKYYFQHVLGITTDEEMEESMGMHEMGNAIHNVLEHALTPYKGKTLTLESLNNALPTLHVKINAALSAAVGGKRIDFGRNQLYALVAARITENFLRHESAFVIDNQVEILQLEEVLQAELPLDALGIKLKLRGKADRIDRIGGVHRIIDYKTGGADPKKLKYSSLIAFDEQDTDHAKVVQLLCYAYMYLQMNSNVDVVQPMIFGLQKRDYRMPLRFDERIMILRGDLPLISNFLSDVLSPLFDQQLDFMQTDDHEACRYCDFNSVCNRLV
ncbi:MAG: PD-(D/E)XK nuclease family protein [Flavobacteriales bacterium]